MRTIMLINAKGGCGKSTLATNLAAYYASQGKSVVLADFDPQGSALEWLAARPEDRPPIKGIAAWKEPLRVPRATDYVVLDVPAGCRGAELTALVRRIREEMVGNLMKVMTHLTPGEQKAWLQIYTKIYNYCQSKEQPEPAVRRLKSSRVLLTSRRFENGTH